MVVLVRDISYSFPVPLGDEYLKHGKHFFLSSLQSFRRREHFEIVGMSAGTRRRLEDALHAGKDIESRESNKCGEKVLFFMLSCCVLPLTYLVSLCSPMLNTSGLVLR